MMTFVQKKEVKTIKKMFYNAAKNTVSTFIFELSLEVVFLCKLISRLKFSLQGTIKCYVTMTLCSYMFFFSDLKVQKIFLQLYFLA